MKKLIAMLLLFGALGAHAVEKEINILIPHTPGGSIDKYIRIIQQPLEEKLKAPVIVKFMPGAGGRVAINHLQSNPAEFNVIVTTNDLLFDLVSKGEQDQFMLSNVIGETPYILWGHPSGGLPRFKQQLKTKEIVNVGVFGVKGSQESWLGSLTLNNPNFIPYKGGAQMGLDVAGGHTEYTVLTLISAQELYAGNRIVPVFVGSSNKHPLLPTVPTQNELKITTAKTITPNWWAAFYVPSNMDPVALKKFSDAIKEVTATAPGMQGLKDIGMIVSNQSGAEAEKFRQNNIKTYNNMLQQK
jgi:tripartite-type tricarboxylate transporter receptor subunit TctC